jgi:isocitrate lyase
MSLSGRTSTTKAMGQGSTQHQHLVQTEVPPKVLEEWVDAWRAQHGVAGKLKVTLRPHTAGSDLLELALVGADGEKKANVVFASIQDRRGRSILSVRDQNTFDHALRRKRLMTLAHLYLLHRYKVDSVHYVTPTEDNQLQAKGMQGQGLYGSVAQEVGEIIVADVMKARVRELVGQDRAALQALIARK